MESMKLKLVNFGRSLSGAFKALSHSELTRWPIWATALSYYCVFGVVPFMALCFVLAKALGLDGDLNETIAGYMRDLIDNEAISSAILSQMRDFVDRMINNYSGGIMSFAALGVIYWSSYRILTLLEKVLGNIFGYRPPRKPLARLLDYFAIMVFVPLLLIAAAGLTAAMSVFLTDLGRGGSWFIPGGFNPAVFAPLVGIVTPYLILWIIFAWAYAYFSRGLVRWPERLVGGFITTLVFQLVLSLYIRLLMMLTSYSAIYGGFAAIPLFLICIYTGWLIVLAGAEITRRFSDFFASRRPIFSFDGPNTWASTVALAQRVMEEITAAYQAESGGGATSFRRLSQVTGAPIACLGRVVNLLSAAGLLAAIEPASGGRGPHLIPARCPSLLQEEDLERLLAGVVLEDF